MTKINNDDCETRILMVTTYWKDSDGGGIRTFLIHLVEELKSRGAKIDVIFKEGKDPENYQISDNETSLLFPLKAIRAYGKLTSYKPQVIHMHGDLYYYLAAGYLYRLFHKTTLIYTFHTEPAPNDDLPFVRRSLIQFLLNRCDYVTFVSRALQVKVESIWRLKFENSAITYAGVYPERADRESIKEFLKRFKIHPDSTIFLALGMTALSYKAEGLKILIRAFGKIRSKYPNSVLIATRDGSYVKELRELAEREGLKDSVIFTGDLKNPWLALEACDIYTHISLGEGGVSISLLEAMSLGKPIIATPAGGIPEAIENDINGIIVRPDVQDLERSLEFLLENREFARKIGDNASKTANEQFSWRKSADAFLKLYTKN